MFSFLGRSKMTCKSLAETMAPQFLSMWMREFDEDLQVPEPISWVKRARTSQSDVKARQEWLLFCIAGYFLGCRASMGESELHFTFARDFLEVFGGEIESQRVFPTAKEFSTMSKLRSAEYWNLMSGSDPGHSILLVAGKFLQNVGCIPVDVAQAMVISSKFSSTTTTTKELFDKVKRTIRLVPA